MKSVSYMGHLLTPEGVKADPAKVKAIIDMPVPHDVPSVQRLLGFVNYLSRFLPRLSHICEPLRRLTDKGAPWLWTSRHTDAVEAVETAVTDFPVLRYYDVVMKGPKILVPAAMRSKMLGKIHYSHIGADSYLRKARDVLFWPGMAKAIHAYISKCAICNEFRPQQQKEPLIPHDTPKLPWADVAVDLLYFDSDNYVVAVDYFSDFFCTGTAARYDHDIRGGNAQAFVCHTRHSRVRSDRQRPAASF